MAPESDIWVFTYTYKKTGFGWIQRELFLTDPKQAEKLGGRIQGIIEGFGYTFAWGVIEPLKADSNQSIEDSLYPNITVH